MIFFNRRNRYAIYKREIISFFCLSMHPFETRKVDGVVVVSRQKYLLFREEIEVKKKRM